MIWSNGWRLWRRDDPEILSTEGKFEYKALGEAKWTNLSRVMLEISDYPGNLIDLDLSR